MEINWLWTTVRRALEAEQGHWSEQPPRFSVRDVRVHRKSFVRSTVTVGGCRSVLSLGDCMNSKFGELLVQFCAPPLINCSSTASESGLDMLLLELLHGKRSVLDAGNSPARFPDPGRPGAASSFFQPCPGFSSSPEPRACDRPLVAAVVGRR